MQLLVLVVCAAEILTLLLLCRPIQKIWNQDAKGICGSVPKVQLGAAGTNLVFDTLSVLLPLLVIWGLQMSKHRKIGVSATFGLSLW